MTLRMVEGFDIDNATANLQHKHENVSGTWTAGTGRLQGKSMSSGGTAPIFRTKDLTSQGTWFLGVAVKPKGLTAEQKIAVLQDDTNEQVSLWIVPGSVSTKVKFRVKRGATTLGTTASEWTENFWIYVEWKVVLDTTGTNGSTEIKVNETSELSVTGTDTTNHSSSVANKVQFHFAQDGAAWLYDDIYICDNVGAAPQNTYLGDVVVEGKLPNAEGNRNQWTPNLGAVHYDRVNQEIIDDDVTYLSIANTSDAQVELFAFPDITQITGTIFGVQVTFACRMDTSGTDNVRPIFRSGGGSEATGTQVTVNQISGYQWFTQVYETDPVAVAAWTIGNFNAMEFGLESRP